MIGELDLAQRVALLTEGAAATAEEIDARVARLLHVADTHGEAPQGVLATGMLAVIDAIRLAGMQQELGIREELTKTRHDLKNALAVPHAFLDTVERLAARIDQQEDTDGSTGSREGRGRGRRAKRGGSAP